MRTALGHAEDCRTCAEGGWTALTAPAAASRQALQHAWRQAGPLAERHSALATSHAAETPSRAALLAARHRHGDLDAAFDAADLEEQER